MCEAADTDDGALLGAFAREGSESAFRSLVERHSGWVYAAAFRQLRDVHLAEDATQAVFMLLCQRAKKMKPRQKVSGWLFMALGYTVRSILRSRRRRRRHENLAAIERPASYAPPPLADDLDAAVTRLSENDRVAILLRFYQGMDFGAMSRALGISDETAKKRVARAIGRLRQRLGASVSADTLTAASSFGAPVALAALNARVSHVALSAAAGGAVPAAISPAMQGAGYLMAMTKVKIAALAIIALLTATGAGIVGWGLFIAPADPNAASAAPSPAAATAPPTFQQAYGLQGNEVIRRVTPPFVKARMDFLRKINPQQARISPEFPGGVLIYQRNGAFQLWDYPGKDFYLNDLVTGVLNVNRQDWVEDLRLGLTVIKGDFVVKADASEEQKCVALGKVIGDALGSPVSFTFRDVVRPVIVFRGNWKARNPDGTLWDANRGDQDIQLYGENLDRGPLHRGGDGGTIDEFGNALAFWISEPVVIQASGTPAKLSWDENSFGDGSPENRYRAVDVNLVCTHVAQQTGLSWTQETRRTRTLFIERGK
jgi:RNA polymerase sigma factor (sigma-70 family)